MACDGMARRDREERVVGAKWMVRHSSDVRRLVLVVDLEQLGLRRQCGDKGSVSRCRRIGEVEQRTHLRHDNVVVFEDRRRQPLDLGHTRHHGESIDAAYE